MQRLTGEQTARIRARRGESLRKFGQLIGCSHTAVMKIERGKFVPNDDLVVTIAAVGGIVPGQMLFYAQSDRAAWGTRQRVNF